jgi:mannose-6-phosphate isomerase-like protein (cupin superfamily)
MAAAGHQVDNIEDSGDAADSGNAGSVGDVIVNPVSGERIVIRTTAAETGGELLRWELNLAPGGRVPSAHAHPEQEERFTVIDGRLDFRLAGRPVSAGPGQTVAVPPGTVHSFANTGPVSARALVETRPALDMQALLETAAAMAQEQQAAARRGPRLLDLMLFMSDFAREVRAPYLPRALVRLVTRTLAGAARRLGSDARYRRLRARCADRAGRADHAG